MPRGDPPEHAFWSREDVAEAIDTIATNDGPLTIVVGAGSSAEAGLPVWSELLVEMLREIAELFDVPEDEPGEENGISAFCDWTLEYEGLPGAGGVLRAALGDRFETSVMERLYRRVGPDPLPGPTAKAVASLAMSWGREVEIVTLNYDFLLETALVRNEGLPDHAVITAADGDEHPEGRVVVRHLHGARGATADHPRTCGELVLAEYDYMTLADDCWQETYFRKRLEESTCLFVGVSMSDPNLLRFLYRQRPEPRHVAVLPRQGDNWRRASLAGVRQAREAASDLRWRDAGVTPIRCDFFIQSAQLLHEVLLRHVLEDGYRPYRDRMIEWEEIMLASLLQTEDREAFVADQTAVSDELEEMLGVAREIIEADVGPLPADEQLGLHLWARLFTTRELVLWGASDRSWRDPMTLRPVPIELPTRYISVLGFCQGSPISRATTDTHSRWNYVTSIPLFVDQDAYFGRLPVGVLTIASTVGDGNSGLERLSPTGSDLLREFLSPLATDFLSPYEEEQAAE